MTAKIFGSDLERRADALRVAARLQHVASDSSSGRHVTMCDRCGRPEVCGPGLRRRFCPDCDRHRQERLAWRRRIKKQQRRQLAWSMARGSPRPEELSRALAIYDNADLH